MKYILSLFLFLPCMVTGQTPVAKDIRIPQWTSATAAPVNRILNGDTSPGKFPWFNASTGVLEVSPWAISTTGAVSWPDGVRQTFNPSGTTAGFNPGIHTSDPSSASEGDIYIKNTSGVYSARIYLNGAWGDLGSGASPSGVLVAANNLSDVNNTATSRTNLGLGNVSNTSDANKPVSTAQQTALDLKANLTSPVFSGLPYTPAITTVKASSRAVFDGDSIPAGSGLNAGEDFPSQVILQPNWTGRVTKSNFAVSGNVISQVAARYTGSVFPLRPAASGSAETHLFCAFGTNDIYAGTSGATAATAYLSYCSTARADGFTVWAFTLPDRSNFTGAMRVQAQEFNRLVRASASWDRLVDVALIFQDHADTSLFLDGIHPSANGALIYAKLINELAGRAYAPVTVGGSALSTGPLKATSAAIGGPGNLDYQNVFVRSSDVDYAGISLWPKEGTATVAARPWEIAVNTFTSGSLEFIVGTDNSSTLLTGTRVGDFDNTGLFTARAGAAVTGNLAVSATVTANLFSGSGASLTSLNGTNIASGTVPADRMGSGGAAGKFLRYDNTWQDLSGTGGDVTADAAFSNDNRLLRSDGTGKGAQASAITVDDSGNVTGVGSITAADLVITNSATLPVGLVLTEAAAPATPATNKVVVYAKADGLVYGKDDAGTETALSNGAGSGVTSVAQSFTGGLISVSGSPITSTGTLALTVAGTSGGIPYFSSSSAWASSAALAANSIVLGGGAGTAPATTTTGTGVVTALGVNVGSAGAFVVNGGALGTPSSGVGTALTGLQHITSGNDPDISTAGDISYDTNGNWVRGFDGTNQVALGRKQDEIAVTVIAPNDLADAARDKFIIWTNKSGMSFIVTGWDATGDTDNTDLTITEMDNDGANATTVDAVSITTDGTSLFYASDTTITAATIENGHRLYLNFDDTDTPGQVSITIYGYYDANVN